jgi:hypothetical protein
MTDHLARIEQLATRLVQDAPALDGDVIAELCTRLEAVGSRLALTISRIVELVHEGLVDPALSLPAIAEACATLVAGERGQVDARVLAAAEYQIDTLTPVPDRPAGPELRAPDVPLTNLGPRRRT